MIDQASLPSAAAAIAQGLALAAYVAAQGLIVVYASHRYLTLWRWRRARRALRPPAQVPESWPCVTVQLPVFNERLVVERLIDAVAALDYPRDRLEIQVLDDSTDETTARAAAAVARHRARGIDIRLLHRRRRDGYKAGALAAGLEAARGELLAVLDADFVPRPDFLRRVVPAFGDPRIGMVQARWGHLNRERSMLTAAQAVMLDAHFMLEHEVRMRERLFFNFNGTAGVWRRACVESAGGWTHDTLTEDLDLSYRAQLAGWRFAFDGTTECPAELPGDMAALKSQQRRWTKGSIQTARKLLPAIFAADLPGRVKIEAFFHLTANVAYPLLIALALLMLPVMLGAPVAPPWLVAVVHAALIVLGILPVVCFLAAGQRALGRGGGGAWRDVAAALLVGVGLSVNNASAALEGLRKPLGDWERTPKTGDGLARPRLAPYSRRVPRWTRAEIALTLYFVGLTILAWNEGHRHALPFLVLLAGGFGSAAVASLRVGRPLQA